MSLGSFLLAATFFREINKIWENYEIGFIMHERHII